MKSRTACLVTTLCRGDGNTETEFDVEVFGLVDSPYKGSWNEPPNNGGVDGVRALYYDGFKQRDIQLTQEELEEFKNELWLRSSEEDPSGDYDDNPFYDDED